MPAQYVPGKPNPYFPIHKYCGVPIDRNIKPIGECRVKHYADSMAEMAKGIAVHLLTPEHLWATFQAEAEDLIKVNHSLNGNEQLRNKRINAAYAKLWLADNRFQWAGLAAFASKQVGCGLLHATNIINKNQSERDYAQRSLPDPGVVVGSAVLAATDAGSAYMFRKLGFGNSHLFLDIYPLHRFYMERGWKELAAYLETRRKINYPVHWEVDRQTLAFATPFIEIVRGFECIENGDYAHSVEYFAQHEQVNILQRILYNDPVIQKLLDTNQYSWVVKFPTGDAQKIELTLSAQCKAKDGFTLPFSRDKFAKLWVVEQRLKFVLSAAKRFNQLLNSPERANVEKSIREIAAGGGVQ